MVVWRPGRQASLSWCHVQQGWLCDVSVVWRLRAGRIGTVQQGNQRQQRLSLHPFCGKAKKRPKKEGKGRVGSEETDLGGFGGAYT